MPNQGVVPLNVNYNNQNGYSLNPPNPNISKSSTVQFNASDQDCTICFNPTTTPFGASKDVTTESPAQVDVGNSDYSVGYCITNLGGTCAAPAPPFAHNSPTGTIKVGSGGQS